MNKCEKCIIRQLNPLKALTRDELIRISNCKTSKTVKKGELIEFKEQKLIVEGESTDRMAISKWITVLNSYSWVESAQLLSYLLEIGRSGYFNIHIKTTANDPAN